MLSLRIVDAVVDCPVHNIDQLILNRRLIVFYLPFSFLISGFELFHNLSVSGRGVATGGISVYIPPNQSALIFYVVVLSP